MLPANSTDGKPDVMFGRRVASLRALRGWSQAELAERIGRTQATVSRIEGGSTPSLGVASALALALGTNLDYLVNGTDKAAA